MNIVIVGGGTAGWIAALMISKVHTNHTVTLIESSKLGIIGVGESTTGLLTGILSNSYHNFGCDIHKFIRQCNATLKYGIKFVNWSANGNTFIAPIDGSLTSELVPDYALAYGHCLFDPETQHLSSFLGTFIEEDLSPVNKDTNNLENINFAFHIDTYEFGKYIKEVLQTQTNFKYFDSEVEDIFLDSTGDISSIRLSSNEVVNGDFFVDASGFKKVLMSKLNSEWVDYSQNLPVNSAIPFWLEYEEGETPDPFTQATAMDAGWMWCIPLQNRKGMGYVFCDKFITPEQAIRELESKLGRKIESRGLIKFVSGRQKDMWKNNTVAIGLCAAFTEPLEAQSIHSTIVQIHDLVYERIKDTKEQTMNTGSKNIYNQRMSMLYDDIRDFLVIHYMGGRTDTPFWKFISEGSTKTEKVINILETCKSKLPTSRDFLNYIGHPGWGLWSYILWGLNKFPEEIVKKELEFCQKIHNFSIEELYIIAEKTIQAKKNSNYKYSELFNKNVLEKIGV